MIGSVESRILCKVVFILHELIIGKVLAVVLGSIVVVPLNILLASLSVDHFLELAALRALGQESRVATLFTVFVFVLFDEIHNIHFFNSLRVTPWACLLHLPAVEAR